MKETTMIIDATCFDCNQGTVVATGLIPGNAVPKRQVSIKTKKAAREAGFHEESRIFPQARSCEKTPKRRVKPVIVKGALFYRDDQLEEVITKTEAKRRGLRPKPNAKPVGERTYSNLPKVVTACMYRISDMIPFERKEKEPATEIPLLEAIFRVNRSAKRYRDAANRSWLKSDKGKARGHTKQKRNLYHLKTLGLRKAIKDGLCEVVGANDEGTLYSYRSCCKLYSFHSPELFAPLSKNKEPIPNEFFVEPKKSNGEPRLCDAVLTLGKIDEAEVEAVVNLAEKPASRPIESVP